MYSRAFRRLSGKTQVFLAGFRDHARTRLTHTLEVAQIAKTISRKLQLDENLTEAIALGHDLGHTPFGHIGERSLNYILNGCEDFTKDILRNSKKGFKHNLQSVRVVVDLEPSLNLTNFLHFGLSVHTKTYWPNCKSKKEGKCLISLNEKGCDFDDLKIDFYHKYAKYMCLEDSDNLAWSFEAFVVKLSDEIAQRHHDLEDALEGSLVKIPQIRKIIERHFEPLSKDMNEYNYNLYKKVVDFKARRNR